MYTSAEGPIAEKDGWIKDKKMRLGMTIVIEGPSWGKNIGAYNAVRYPPFIITADIGAPEKGQLGQGQ